MCPNIKDLDGPLRFGDQTQIAAVKALESGDVPCLDCGMLIRPDPDASETRNAYCYHDYQQHLCRHCGEFIQDVNDLSADRICEYCRWAAVERKNATAKGD
jgi:hypothetical protein